MSSPDRARPALSLTLALGLALLASASTVSAVVVLPEPPDAGDRTAPALRIYQQELLDSFGGDHRNVPLDVKAEFFEWQIWQYHVGPHQQVMPRAVLPDTPEGEIHYPYGADISTWNGALLAALSRKYAVTRDPLTLARISELLEGMHLFLEATGQPGLLARTVLPSPEPLDRAQLPYPTEDGELFHYRADPAKGTLNQVALGYAALMMHVFPDLEPSVREQAHEDLISLVLHLIRHDYRMTELDGRPSKYGSLRPLLWGHGVPFNAHVAYMVIATGATFPPRHPEQIRVIEDEFRLLREENSYWEPWWKPPFIVRPQRIVKSRFIKTNDVNHLVNAVYTGLALELYTARRDGREPDPRFLQQFGETLYWSLGKLELQRNSLCNFMVADVFDDEDLLEAIVPREPDATRERTTALLDTGLEQLRRFTLDRFRWEGHEVTSADPHWVDEHRPDAYHWKVDASLGWKVTGPPTNTLISAIDYLHAYWVLRESGLDRHPAVLARHAGVLGSGLPAAEAARTPGPSPARPARTSLHRFAEDLEPL
jgi:hypothetical protein